MATSYTKSFDDFVSATLDRYTQTKFQDNVFDDIPLFNMMMRAGRYVPADGGNDILQPVMLSTNSTAKAYSEYEDLDVTPQDAGTVARYQWARYAVTVAISGDERDRNSGKHQIIDLLKGKMDQAEMSLRDKMSTDLFSVNDGTDGKSLIGLRAMVDPTPSGTFAGIDASVETSWQNQADTSAITFSSTGEAEMASMFNNCTQGSRRPDLIVTTQAIFEAYESSLRSDGRVLLPVGLGDGGFPALNFKGVPVIWDRDCPASHIFYLNTRDSLKLRYHPGRNFRLSEPKVPANKDATYWQILWRGQLTANERRILGVQSAVS